MSSPVLHKILFELDEEYEDPDGGGYLPNPDRRLMLDPRLGGVHLALYQSYSYLRLDIEGVPPIVVETLLDYMYKVVQLSLFLCGFFITLKWSSFLKSFL